MLPITPDTPGLDETSIEVWHEYVELEYENGGVGLRLAEAMARACRDQARVSVDILLASRVSAALTPRLTRMIGFDIVSQGGSFLEKCVIPLGSKQDLTTGDDVRTTILYDVVATLFGQRVNEWGLLSSVDCALALCEAANALREFDEMLGVSPTRWPYQVYQIEIEPFDAGA